MRQPDRPGTGDRVFSGGSTLSGVVVLAIMVGVGLFLTIEAWPAFRQRGFSFFTTSVWEPNIGEFGVASILGFTALIAAVAVTIAVPLSLLTALFITDVAPVWMRSTLVALVDLMAAVPSVVYGLCAVSAAWRA